MGDRKKPVRVLGSPLTGRYYAVTRYSETEDGRITVHSNGKHDVTADVQALIEAALAASTGEAGR